MPQLYNLSKNDMKELTELGVGRLGVVRKNYANAMSDTSKILVVGLGGMGLSSVHELKKTLIGRIGTLREADIQFLAFDTSEEDLSSRRNAGPLTIAETCLLHSPSLAGIMRQQEHLRPIAFRDPMPPQNSGFNPTFSGQGAGQVRLTGRLTIMDNNTYNDVVTDLKNAITKLGDFSQRKLEIHVISGVGGGTGSGLCVDMPYIIRHVADLLHIPEANRRLFGYVYLPNVYDTIPNINIKNIYRNGYAALKEIDYYMNIDSIYETFDAVYPDGPYSTTKPIYDFCTLIGGYPDGPIVIEDTKRAAITACVENLVNQVTRTVSKSNAYDKGSNNSSMADIFTGAAFRDNVAAYLKVVLESGNCNFHESGNYKYNYVGSSSLQFPTESIIEYFTGEVFQKTIAMLESNATKLTQKDVDDFEKGLVAPLEMIRMTVEEFTQKVEETFASTTWNKTVVATRDVETTLNVMMNNAFKKFDEQGDLITKACGRVGNKAADIFKNPAKGPYFLARLLTASSGAGGGIVGYYEKLGNYSRACAVNIENLTISLQKNKQQRDKLADTMQRFGHFNSNLENYKTVLREIWKDELKIRLYQKMSNDYYLPLSSRIGVCYQIRNTLDSSYLNYADMLTYIGEIMASNAAEEKNAVFSDDIPGSIFQLNSIEFDALKNSVRHKITSKLRDFAEQDVSNFAGALLNEVVSNAGEWVLRGVNPLESAPVAVRVREFLYNYPAFADITAKTFTDYFEDAYHNETDAQKDKIVRSIADKLKNDAAPMCNKFEPFSWLDVNVLCHRFMVLPSNMGDTWGDLFTSHLGSKNQNVLLSPDQNAIYNYTLYAAMPMWLHGDMVKYEERYNALKDKDAGFHINESPKMDPPYVDYPPLMPPQQWHRARQGSNEYRNESELEYRAQLETVIRQAIDCGILAKNSQGYYVVELLANRPTEQQLDSFFEDYTENRANYASDGMLIGGTRLHDALTKQFGCTVMEIYQIRSVRADDEQNLLELIRRQMKLTGKLKSELKYFKETVTKRVDDIVADVLKNRNLRSFSTCMLYGLIGPDEMNRWNYRLGDELVNITSSRKIKNSADAFTQSLADYMELAAFRAFFELPKANEHLVLLRDQLNEMDDFLDSHPGESEISTAIKTNYATYTEKANRVLTSMKRKVASGRSLSMEDVEIREFYEKLLNCMQDLM